MTFENKNLFSDEELKKTAKKEGPIDGHLVSGPVKVRNINPKEKVEPKPQPYKSIWDRQDEWKEKKIKEQEEKLKEEKIEEIEQEWWHK